MTLTAKQQRFVDEFLVDLNATQAAIRAGYSPKTARQVASENLTKPNIASAIAARQKKLADKAEWTAAERLSSLKAIHDAQKENDARVAISAIAEANKMQGSHAPAKKEIAGPHGGPIPTMDVTNLTDDQLAALEAAFSGIADDTEGDASEG
ncbi:terminase small subunit [Maritalea myrionectae]|uniref:Terminase small subunit n=1 Tax=Maritalea myrionectae TaxID=454601 RepID=A0A2R4ME63_9HYPH|nr:terminase small subunit [Maritalea myrionectae]AVX04328.1 terminase small subunit [Maritalea myrionectae]